MELKSLISDFAERVRALIEASALERAKASVLQAFGISAPRKLGRPPKDAAAKAAPAKKARKKAPIQLCPVPGCKNAASPALGMVCGKHRDVPKRLIKQYREARRLKKLGLKAPKRTAAVAKKRRSAPKKMVAKKRRSAPKSVPKKVVTKRRAKAAGPRTRVVPTSTPTTAPTAPEAAA